MQQKLLQNFFTTRSWSFWKLHRKGTAKATNKNEKTCILYIYREYLLCLQSNASGSFLQKCINFAEHRLKFSHFEGSAMSVSATHLLFVIASYFTSVVLL